MVVDYHVMIERYLQSAIREALADTPVILIIGARQTGKSTLVQTARLGKASRYFTLDDAPVLAAIKNDPAGFLAGLGDGLAILDEVQRVPELFLALKAQVDRNRRPGRFILTGSANVLLLPKIADSLAGRMEVLTLWPLSQGEIAGVREGFIDAIFAPKLPSLPKDKGEKRTQLIERICLGGYPEIVARSSPARRKAWFESYVTTILQRDVRDLANIDDVSALPRLLALLAARSGTLVNFAEISRSVGLPQSTLKRYQSLLEKTFLIRLLPAWSGNLGKRLIQTPKIYLNDTGLLASRLGATPNSLTGDAPLLGPLLENFVLAELQKQIGWSETKPRIFHWRTASNQEVDFVLEDDRGRLVGIEVKATASLGANHLLGMRALAEAAGKRFVRGVIFYTGDAVVPFAANIHAMPLRALWELNV